MHLIKFERFLCWKSRNHSQHFSVDFFSRNLSRIINYWGSIFTLYLTWGAFRLVFVLSVFFFSFFFSCSFFFVFYLHFPWQALTGSGEWIIIFIVFHLHPLTNIYLVHRDFYHFVLIDLFVITKLIADETCSL